MGTADEDELARLQRAAFARGGTEEDLEALADALAAEDAVGEPVVDPGVERVQAPGETIEPTASVEPPTGRRAWTVRLAALGLVALVAGAAAGWMLRDAVAGPAQSPTLAAFAGLPEAENPWPESLTHADSRLLGEIGGVRFIGTTGTSPANFPGPPGPLVCLHIEDGEAGGGSCTTRERFEAAGLWVGLSTAAAQRTYFWGPDGPPAILVCDPQRWLVNCPAEFNSPTVPTLAP